MNISSLLDDIQEKLKIIDLPIVIDALSTDYQKIAEQYDPDCKVQLEDYMQAVLVVIAENKPDFLEKAVEHQRDWRSIHVNQYGFKIDSRVDLNPILNHWPSYQLILKEVDQILRGSFSQEEMQALLREQGQLVLGEYGLKAYEAYFEDVGKKTQLLSLSDEGLAGHKTIEKWAENNCESSLRVRNRNHTPLPQSSSNFFVGQSSAALYSSSFSKKNSFDGLIFDESNFF